MGLVKWKTGSLCANVTNGIHPHESPEFLSPKSLDLGFKI